MGANEAVLGRDGDLTNVVTLQRISHVGILSPTVETDYDSRLNETRESKSLENILIQHRCCFEGASSLPQKMPLFNVLSCIKKKQTAKASM